MAVPDYKQWAKSYRSQRGFTLIELLVSLFIMTTVSTVVLGIIWFSLKSTVKVNNQNLIRQNGNYAISQLLKMLQFAQRFQGVSPDGVSYSQNCDGPLTMPLRSFSHVAVIAPDNSTVIVSCETSPQTIASNGAPLINTAAFNVPACRFTCIQDLDGGPVTIGIQFNIQKLPSGSIFDDPAALRFETSATIRNIY